MRISLKTIIIGIGFVLLMGIAVRPSFSSYLIGTSDGFAHKYRLENFHISREEGNLYPRWLGSSALGFGAPLFIFNYFVPYYVVNALYTLTGTIQLASQWYAALTILASGIAMFLVAKRLWGLWAGLVSAIVYTYAPYHLLTVYSYEAWGEMLAFMFPPLILYFLYLTLKTSPSKRPYRIWYALTIVSWVLFLFTHNIAAYITSPMIMIMGYLLSKKDSTSVFILLKIGGLALLISSFLHFPAITLAKTINVTAELTTVMAERSRNMAQLLSQVLTSWHTMAGQHIYYREFTVGIPILAVSLISTVLVVWIWTKNRRPQPFIISLLVMTWGSLFFMDPASTSLYVFRPLQYVLYPYRFLFLTTFTGSLLAGYLSKKSYLSGVIIVTLAVLFGLPFTHPYLELFPFPQSYFKKPQLITYAVPTLKNMSIQEYLPATADMNFLMNEEQAYIHTGVLPQKFMLPEGTGQIESQIVKQESLSASLNTNVDTTLTVSTLYYPDWQATIDNRSTPMRHDTFGRITLPIPKGSHQVRLVFGRSVNEKIGIALSLLGIVMFLWTVFF